MTFWETFFIAPLANGLVIFYRLLGENMGVAIIVFSLILKIVLNPLSKTQLESAKKMKDLAPRLEKLKKKYKNNPTKLAQVQADLYKENGVNPLGGCLPQLLQLAILIAFYGVFTRTLYPGINTVDAFNNFLYSPLKFAEGAAINTKFFNLDITKPDVFKLSFLPFVLPGAFLILSTVAQFLSIKIMEPYVEVETKMAKKTKGVEDDMQVAMQKSMSYTFPILTLLIGVKFPSGLVLYWLVFSVFQLVQQYKMSGWGALTPLIRRIGLIKSR